jgi:glutamate dehydrogenase
VSVVPGSGLGILRDTSTSAYAAARPLAAMPFDLRSRYESGDLLTITKTNRVATVHRRVRMDYVSIRRLGPDGRMEAEARLVGLFTHKAYMESITRTPVIRRKLQQILAAEDLIEGSHDHKAVIQILEGFPRDELLAAPAEDLRRSVMSLVQLQESRQVRLFVRRDLLDRAVSILVSMPRDRFNAEVRRNLQEHFRRRYGGTTVDYHLALGEGDQAQVFFTVWVEGTIPEVSYNELEREVAELTRTWESRLRDRLAALHGGERADRLVARWVPALPDYYKTPDQLDMAVADVTRLDELAAGDGPFLVGLQTETGAERLTRLALYRRSGKLPLSDLIPALEDLGLRVVEEVPTRLVGEAGDWFIHDFGVLGPGGAALDLATCGERVRQTVTAVWSGEGESDSLNRLVVVSPLDRHDVEVLRALRTYARRVGASFTLGYVNDTLVEHAGIAADLVELFRARFDPAREGEDAGGLRERILRSLDAVPSLEQDRILRNFLGSIEAMVRTNAYRPGRRSLAFKLRSAAVPELPKPYPLFEVFVYAPEVEGIHLRGGMVARGGIRWSDRREDYRTEVLGLMKAQMTKNAVIVPTGAKGGFVVRRPAADPAAQREAVRSAYVTFVRGLLDVTDNLVDGKPVSPPGVRAHDGPDTYLVVAADKGTATFSDLANMVAEEYGFWLGDAFASGGSAGYDHKALGITARGAWESGKRHFLEAGIDWQQPFTAVGIGDMSGDVFGNGMIAFDTIRLVAAFDHRHVFVDPDPDPVASHAERARLFGLPGSSWADYDPALISPGGGVWPRTAKRVDLSPEARRSLGIEAAALTPTELIRAVLRAPVDLLWNGGIGTYVKAAAESHADAGDRTNDAVRVDAAELRCRVVVEGGNLGFTQLGRIEFARAGGRINTDFIDNSGGVDCSDREVNLKILLAMAEADGRLDRAGRNELVAAVASDVVERILYDNYQQAQIVSQAVVRSPSRMQALEALMQGMEAQGVLDREVEGLPRPAEMRERRANGQGMTRPELAVLLAYSKATLDAALLRSSLPDEDYLLADLQRYFPAPVVERFTDLLARHPLRRELVSTLVANDLVNSMGITFATRLASETGADAAQVARAYRIARDVTRGLERWEAIESHFGKIDLPVFTELMNGADWLVGVTARWFLSRGAGFDLAGTISQWRPAYAELEAALPVVGSEEWRADRGTVAMSLVEAGVPQALAERHAYQPELAHAPDVIDLSRRRARPLLDVARIFHLLGDAAHLNRLVELAHRLPGEGMWQRWAAQTLEDDLLYARRQLAEVVIAGGDGLGAEKAVHGFLEDRSAELGRLHTFLRSLESEESIELPHLTVAARQVRGLLG